VTSLLNSVINSDWDIYLFILIIKANLCKCYLIIYSGGFALLSVIVGEFWLLSLNVYHDELRLWKSETFN
jgi:hypothetical protein